MTANFDALDWFQTTSDRKIEELIECGFADGLAADEVARHFAEWGGVSAVLAHSQRMSGVLFSTPSDLGAFDCRVDAEAAKAWLAANRPVLYARNFNKSDRSEGQR